MSDPFHFKMLRDDLNVIVPAPPETTP